MFLFSGWISSSNIELDLPLHDVSIEQSSDAATISLFNCRSHAKTASINDDDASDPKWSNAFAASFFQLTDDFAMSQMAHPSGIRTSSTNERTDQAYLSSKRVTMGLFFADRKTRRVTRFSGRKSSFLKVMKNLAKCLKFSIMKKLFLPEHPITHMGVSEPKSFRSDAHLHSTDWLPFIFFELTQNQHLDLQCWSEGVTVRRFPLIGYLESRIVHLKRWFSPATLSSFFSFDSILFCSTVWHWYIDKTFSSHFVFHFDSFRRCRLVNDRSFTRIRWINASFRSYTPACSDDQQ